MVKNIFRIAKTLIPHILILLALLFLVLYPQIKKVNESYPDRLYLRIHGTWTMDYFIYLSEINQGLGFEKPIAVYTTEPNLKTYNIHFFYHTLGRIGKILNMDHVLSVVYLYHNSIIISLFLFYIFTFLLIRELVDKKFQLFTLLIIFFSSPPPTFKFTLLGKEFFFQSSTWINFLKPNERNYLVPHHMFGVAMLVATVFFFIKFLKTSKKKWIIFTLLSHFLGTAVYFVTGLVFSFSTFVWTLLISIKRKLINGKFIKLDKVLAVLGIFVITAICYFLIVADVVNRSGLGELEFSTTAELAYPDNYLGVIVSLGPIFFFVIFGIISFFKKKSQERLLIMTIFLTPFILYFLTASGFINTQKLRYFIAAPYVFGAIIAVWGIAYIYSYLKKKFAARLFLLLVFIIFAGNIILGIKHYWIPNIAPGVQWTNLYIPLAYLDAYDFLNKNTKLYSHVLPSSFDTGHVLPAFARSVVYAGDISSTKDYAKKIEQLQSIYKGEMAKQDFDKLIKDNDIDYIFWEASFPLHKKYSKNFKLVYENHASGFHVYIYKGIDL